MRVLCSLLLIALLAPMVGAQSIGEVLQECPGTITGSDAPEQVHLQATDDPTQMVVIWATEAATGAEVEWNGQNAVGESYCYNHDMAFHMATMTDLTPGEEVTYRVGDGSTWSAEMQFTPIDMAASQIEWISIGDHGMSDEGLAVSDAIAADSATRFVTISGDISYADGTQSEWDEYFSINTPSMQEIPWLTAVGNHENEPGYGFTPYAHRFDADGVIESEPFWYSRNVPGVHMVFMSTEHDYTSGSAQFNWLENDLASVERDVTPFVIVFGHKPMYSSNAYHGSEVELRDALEALYVTHEVDLVIAGHDHFYERTWPVENELGSGEGNLFDQTALPIHLVIGMGGRSAYEELEEPQPTWSAYRENSTYGWTRWVYDADAGTLEMTHHRIDGSIGDTLTLQTAPLPSHEDGGLIIGFESGLILVAFAGAAVRRLR